MLEAAAWLVLALVCGLLAWGLTRQFAVTGRRGAILDRFAIVPQWKFFAQQRIDGNPETFADLHLLARTASGVTAPGPWRDLLHWTDRPWHQAVWNPHRHSRTMIGYQALLLVEGEDRAGGEGRLPPTALAYLTVLRFALEQVRPQDDAVVKFAVATTLGRGRRDPQLRFLSAWHCR
jgi:hypothetical protein